MRVVNSCGSLHIAQFQLPDLVNNLGGMSVAIFFKKNFLRCLPSQGPQAIMSVAEPKACQNPVDDDRHPARRGELPGDAVEDSQLAHGQPGGPEPGDGARGKLADRAHGRGVID